MSALYTIGYEGTDIERFVATLKAVKITTLVDVRAIAQSRKKGFSKNGLGDRLRDEGIQYVHLVDLGDPKPGREAAKAGHYDEFRRIYTSHIAQPEPQAALHHLRELLTGHRVCLLCFERDPKTCHRSIVAETFSATDCEVFDLYADDPGRYVRNASKLPSSDDRQGFA